jgi:hypothetical protein
MELRKDNVKSNLGIDSTQLRLDDQNDSTKAECNLRMLLTSN